MSDIQYPALLLWMDRVEDAESRVNSCEERIDVLSDKLGFAERDRAALLAQVAVKDAQIERLANYHVPPDHHHESGTMNPDGECWVCQLQKPIPGAGKYSQSDIGWPAQLTPPAEEKPRG